MARKDQRMRNSGQWNKKVDKENTKKLKKIVAGFGWPDFKLVGKRVSHLAWLIVQHADHDVDFQERCLQLMEEKSKAGLVNSANVAYLTDRVRVKQGKKQLYGTQFYVDQSGNFKPRPIYKIKELRNRRKKMGLENFGAYQKRIQDQNQKLHK